MIIQSCAETDEWVGIFCAACCLPKCAAVWPVVRYSKHDKKVKKLRLFQTFASLVNRTLSGRTCAVWILRKNYMCLLQALWMTAVALEHTQRVSRQLHSLIRHLLPLWRIQRMLCIESVNSPVCHAGRLRSTVLMTSYKMVHISSNKRVAWSSKQAKVLHITSSWWHHQMETFSTLLALCAGNSLVPMNSPHKGQWRGALIFSLICVWINSWINNREAGDLRHHRGHPDVSVMYFLAIMPPKKRQKQTLMSAFTRYRYVLIIDSWSLVTRF